jgi:hypothetical protein
MKFPAFFPLILALLATHLVGCGKDPNAGGDELGTIRWQNFPVEVQLETSLYQDNDFRADLQDASNFWEQRAGKSLFVYRESSATPKDAYTGNILNPDSVRFNMIFFVSPWPLEGNVAGNTLVRSFDGKIEGAFIMLNGESSFCGGDCTGLSGLSRRKLLAHELGHFLGLDHTPVRENLMFPEILDGAALDSLQVDVQSLNRLTH